MNHGFMFLPVWVRVRTHLSVLHAPPKRRF
jgi:ribosomal protein L39E